MIKVFRVLVPSLLPYCRWIQLLKSSWWDAALIHRNRDRTKFFRWDVASNHRERRGHHFIGRETRSSFHRNLGRTKSFWWDAASIHREKRGLNWRESVLLMKTRFKWTRRTQFFECGSLVAVLKDAALGLLTRCKNPSLSMQTQLFWWRRGLSRREGRSLAHFPTNPTMA